MSDPIREACPACGGVVRARRPAADHPVEVPCPHCRTLLLLTSDGFTSPPVGKEPAGPSRAVVGLAAAAVVAAVGAVALWPGGEAAVAPDADRPVARVVKPEKVEGPEPAAADEPPPAVPDPPVVPEPVPSAAEPEPPAAVAAEERPPEDSPLVVELAPDPPPPPTAEELRPLDVEVAFLKRDRVRERLATRLPRLVADEIPARRVLVDLLDLVGVRPPIPMAVSDEPVSFDRRDVVLSDLIAEITEPAGVRVLVAGDGAVSLAAD